MQQRLIWKVMALNFPVIGLVIGVIWLSIEYLAADYFTELMKHYQIAPNDIHGMFLDSVHQYLAWASAVAFLLAILVSYVLSNRVLRPLNEISRAILKMSEGDRDVRVRRPSNDELGDLAKAFNLMARQINEAESLRENMIVDLAHELRTPTTNIRGYVEGLRDQVISPDNHNLSVLEEEALRLGDLIESLLDLARADAAKSNLSVQQFDMQHAVSVAIKRNAEIFKQKGLNIINEMPREAQHIYADREQLQIVLGVLLQNASLYAPADSEVKIWSERDNHKLSLYMSNPSEIIDSADLSLIFERFYRTEKSRSRNSGGAGIGLAIVKQLVEAHGGSVGASSDGDMFIVWFTIPDQVTPITAPELKS